MTIMQRKKQKTVIKVLKEPNLKVIIREAEKLGQLKIVDHMGENRFPVHCLTEGFVQGVLRTENKTISVFILPKSRKLWFLRNLPDFGLTTEEMRNCKIEWIEPPSGSGKNQWFLIHGRDEDGNVRPDMIVVSDRSEITEVFVN